MSFLSHPHYPTLQIHHTQKSAIPHQPSQKHTTIPRLAPSRLPPLSKGGGLTASHKLSLCCVLLAIQPPFLFTKLFAVKTEGLVYHPSLSTTSMPPLSKVRCCRPKKFGRLPEGLYSVSTINEIFRTIPCPTPRPCLPSKKGRWHGCRGFSTCCTVFR